MNCFDRLELLLGEEGVARLARANVFVCGVGGVGSWAAEMLARCGIGRIVMMDMDTVKPSNINRQLPALHSTINKLKVDVMAERMRDINPEAEIVTMPWQLKVEDVDLLLQDNAFDCVVDAIDERPPKLALICGCVAKGIPIVSSMGAGNKRNPEMVRTADISQTFGCPLAKLIRRGLRKEGIEKGVSVVFSPEVLENLPQTEADEVGGRRPVGSISFMPAVFGMHCAYTAINKLLGTF